MLAASTGPIGPASAAARGVSETVCTQGAGPPEVIPHPTPSYLLMSAAWPPGRVCTGGVFVYSRMRPTG